MPTGPGARDRRPTDSVAQCGRARSGPSAIRLPPRPATDQLATDQCELTGIAAERCILGQRRRGGFLRSGLMLHPRVGDLAALGYRWRPAFRSRAPPPGGQRSIWLTAAVG